MSDLEITITSGDLKRIYDDMRVQAGNEAYAYLSDYIIPFQTAHKNLIIALREVVWAVGYLTKLDELKIALDGKAGEISRCLTHAMERNRQAGLNNDFHALGKDIAKIGALLLNFTSKPTQGNCDALKKELSRLNDDGLNNLALSRENMPKIGRRKGVTDKRAKIWQYAKGYYQKFGAEHAGEKALENIENFIKNQKESFPDMNVEQVYSIEWEALQTLKYTVRSGVQWERKRIDSSKGASLAGYIRQLASDAKKGKLKVASDK